MPLAIGGIALLVAGGGLVLSRWRTASAAVARKRRSASKPQN
jgi:hypothetical protein